MGLGGKSVYLFVVWSFLLFGLFVFFFWLFGRGRGPRPNSKKKTRPPPKQQKKSHRPFRAFVCCLGGWAFLFFFAVWAGACFFCCLGWVRVVFVAVWAGGGGRGFCCLGGGREFTHLLVCLARLQATQQQKRPNSKKQKKTRVPGLGLRVWELVHHLGDLGLAEIQIPRMHVCGLDEG